jgi:nucleotide-binding universal stress UspA family protein
MEEGSAAEQILKTSEEENMNIIVIGGSGKHRLERFILGSVAEKVVRDAKCPVLTVH